MVNDLGGDVLKQCSKCGEWKEEGEYFPRHNYCKVCRRIQNNEYRKNNPEKTKILKRQYYIKNKEAIKKRVKKWRKENTERVTFNRRKHEKEHRKEINERKAQSRLENIKHVRKLEAARRKRYYNNIEKIENRRNRERNYCVSLARCYVTHVLIHTHGFIAKNVTTEVIELKRTQLIMYRTLKQFKQWRKEYESNNADVHGKQFTDEENNEWGLPAKSNCASAT